MLVNDLRTRRKNLILPSIKNQKLLPKIRFGKLNYRGMAESGERRALCFDLHLLPGFRVEIELPQIVKPRLPVESCGMLSENSQYCKQFWGLDCNLLSELRKHIFEKFQNRQNNKFVFEILSKWQKSLKFVQNLSVKSTKFVEKHHFSKNKYRRK